MSDDLIVSTGLYVPRSEFEELGNAAADMKMERDAAIRERDRWRDQYEELAKRFTGIENWDESRKDRALIILQEDLELAINMLSRYAFALGIQVGGLLYDEVQGLRDKYHMGPYRPPSDYNYNDLTRPDVGGAIIEGTESPKGLNA